MFRRSVLLTVLLLATGAALAQARSDYYNVESPQVHPIEVARVGGHDYLLVCNTPDNAVEIYDTDETSAPENRRIARVPVGLEPVSVRYDPATQAFYTANFLGDSVTRVRFAPGAGEPLIEVQATTYVGDEPLDIAFHEQAGTDGDPAQRTLFVSFMNLDGLGWFEAATLAPLAPGLELFEAAFDLVIPPDSVRLALKQPRSLMMHDGDLVSLGTMVRGEVYDFAVNCRDPQTIADGDLSGSRRIGGLGTTHFNMARAANGDVFVVGGVARTELQDEPLVAMAESGFVESTVWMVRDLCGPAPQIVGRDVNMRLTSILARNQPVATATGAIGLTAMAIDIQPVAAPVPKAKALSQLTDVVVFESGPGPLKVFFTAFGNDRIGILEPEFNADPLTWKLRRRAVQALQHPVAGPRGLALKGDDTGDAGDPGPRLYVMNRLDNSVSIFDPVSEMHVETFALGSDPTPGWVRAGQTFLYSSKHSGTGFVACSSCHIDGRTDGQAWDLGTPDATPVEIPDILLDGSAMQQFETWPLDKNLMVTQTLQGLLNWEAEPGTIDQVTNAPYHWRADRADFTEFNPAFEGLMLGDELDPLDMKAYEEFVNSIQHGPNPKQPRNRRYSGTFGDPSIDVLLDPGATGAQRGLRMFHTTRSLPPRSCVHCHSLPEGSNNRLTVPGFQPTESAQLRGLFQREAKRDIDGFSNTPDMSYTGETGMTHDGALVIAGQSTLELFNLVSSTNSFINILFEVTICAGQGPFCMDGGALSQFAHEMDWGTGPMVGYPVTIDADNVDEALAVSMAACVPTSTDPGGLLNCMEEQAREAGSGVAVRGRVAGQQVGYVYDPTAQPPRYRSEPPGSSLQRGALLATVSGTRDYLTFTATPLGSERRVASPTGQPADLPLEPAPDLLTLLPMRTNTANTDIPLLTENWVDFNQASAQSIFVHTLRLYQFGLIQDAAGESGFGLDAVRHDAPRRFRVAGRGIRPGAELHLFTHDDETAGAPNPLGPLDQLATRRVAFPLHPTGDRTGDGVPIWESAIELEPLLYYQRMLGGPRATHVSEVFNDTGFTFADPPPPGTFEPVLWNWHWVRVVNADQSAGDGGWQRLTIE